MQEKKESDSDLLLQTKAPVDINSLLAFPSVSRDMQKPENPRPLDIEPQHFKHMKKTIDDQLNLSQAQFPALAQHRKASVSLPIENEAAPQAQMQATPTPTSLSMGSVNKNKRKRDKDNEIARVQQRVSGFDAQGSDAWSYLCQQYGNKITQDELVSIADAIKPYAGIKLDRDARRRKSVIIKWYQDNWAVISGYLKYVVLED